ncbi:MAG: DoxX family protein [Paenibacillus macerans]|uniref:DoxX family protein n=2 Tax=Paenibacillus TaxID=44249 RepID=A0A090Z348_PAEMA|nr:MULTISPECIES: DoxX family protein [Paenibacillus]KFN05679.1 doxX-like family protein [Paenibacillus macerans]MBS5912105.1 DoxX family protein [Paenibacillus macerans]MCY7559914.1 DoxX family protein [Paenibacillus macerans]MDU7472484.1 DoxX family protein [Paenibacillus macerans]MEC0136865.1 DoxX family protein [Paenibacillus macerans]
MTEKISKGRLWTGRIMSGIVILFMLFDGISKLFKPAVVVEGTLTLGFAEHHIVTIGILALLSTVLYAIPRTAVLGAVLLTAFYGGVVATQIRVDAPLFSHTLFAVYMAILAWGGLWLRNDKVRRLFW